MTTTFKLATTTVFQPRNVTQTADFAEASSPRGRVASETAATVATRHDTTALSASSALSAPAATDPARSARIESLRQSIAAGTYSVPAHDVASAIIDSLL